MRQVVCLTYRVNNMQPQFRVIRGSQAEEEAQPPPGLGPLPKFEEVLVAHLDSLLAFALRLAGGQRGLAEDLLQETCLRAFRNYQSLRAPERIKSWLFRILANTHINEFHRQSRESQIIDVELSEALLESAYAGSTPTPEERLFEQLLDDEVQQALDALPVEFRAVVWLRDGRGRSFQELFGIIACAPGTAWSRLYRGDGLLREKLREYAGQRGLSRK